MALSKLFKWEDPEGKTRLLAYLGTPPRRKRCKPSIPACSSASGLPSKNGFYYDIDPGENTITDADFPKNRAKKMAELAAKNETVERRDISKQDALKFFGDKGQTYKCELINELEDGHITTYTQGDFTDLCRGPHLPAPEPSKPSK